MRTLTKVSSFLRRQESQKESRDLKKNTAILADSCLRRNDGDLIWNNENLYE